MLHKDYQPPGEQERYVVAPLCEQHIVERSQFQRRIQRKAAIRHSVVQRRETFRVAEQFREYTAFILAVGAHENQFPFDSYPTSPEPIIPQSSAFFNWFL